MRKLKNLFLLAVFFCLVSGAISVSGQISDAKSINLKMLVGSWTNIRISEGRETGNTKGTDTKTVYEFSADGKIKSTSVMHMPNGECLTKYTKTMEGTASLTADTLTIKWSPANVERANSCEAPAIQKSTFGAATLTYKISFKTIDNKKNLCLTGENGNDFCLAQDDRKDR